MPPKRTYKKRSAAAKPTQKKLVRTIRRVVNAQSETKYANVDDTTDMDTTGDVYNLTANISQGDADNNSRNGDQVQLNALQYRSIVLPHPTNPNHGILRQCIIKWLPDNNVDAPSIAKIFGTTSTYGAFFHDGRKKFKVLYDSFRHIEKSTSPTGAMFHTKIIGQKRLGKIQFEAGANTGMGHIYLITTSSLAAGTPSTATNYFTCRVHYKDF